jgi:hypothetical protein
MGMMSFLLPDGLPADLLRELERSCVVGGPDLMPWPTDVLVQGNRLTLQRSVEESGAAQIPWDINGTARFMSSSATLMERSQPYSLLVELARGKVNQVRGQAFDWRSGGLALPAELIEEMKDVGLSFGQAVTQESPTTANSWAQTALSQAYRSADHLIRVYLEQVFQVRHQRHPILDTAFGCRLGTTVPQGELASAALHLGKDVVLPFSWSTGEPSPGGFRWDEHDVLLEWAEHSDLGVTVGPLVDFSSARLPAWLWRHEHDVTALSRFMCRYVENVVRRYRSRVRRWQVTAGSNSASLLSLGEEELLLLTVRMAEAARQVDPGIELIVGLAQPWGEYMATEERNPSPFIFADTLIRSGLTPTAFDLELVMGVTPRGSYCRDLLDGSRMLDLYSLLGVPLRVTLGYPSAKTADSLAEPDYRVAGGNWHGGLTQESQADWAEAFATLTVGKPYVQGVFWTHLNDAEPHQFPHTGLIDARGQVKPAFARLRTLREKHLH